ncbi:hypothetical protein PROAA_1320010 [Candidatus Propionivibrio aalborgensis]|uniref:Uncharacterized protein n=1 Tax=Candidatus Propionivibrio aalborgensis TaxID=1860101 RepID=A0A1A8XHF9_9RHOO|nr:hypothetical protein PROAA_1320010 [Candidatus Propionivibrio aalborgensis]
MISFHSVGLVGHGAIQNLSGRMVRCGLKETGTVCEYDRMKDRKFNDLPRSIPAPSAHCQP